MGRVDPVMMMGCLGGTVRSCMLLLVVLLGVVENVLWVLQLAVRTARPALGRCCCTPLLLLRPRGPGHALLQR